MSYRYERRRRSGVSCLAWLVGIVWIILLAMLAYQFFFRDQVSQFVGEQIGQPLQQRAERDVERQLEGAAQDAIPTIVSALPSGELRVTEQQANDYITANAESLQPLESATIRFVPGEIQADLTAAGTTSTAAMGLAVQDGQIIAVNPRIDGLVGQFISAETLAGAFTQQINDQLATQGRRINDVRIEQGAIVVAVE